MKNKRYPYFSIIMELNFCNYFILPPGLKILYRLCIFWAFVFFSKQPVYSQGNLIDKTDNLKNTAPEAAAMQKFIDMPVSYFSGNADITVPIYTIVGKKALNIPIVLKYHSGGIAATEVAGVFGLGWSLDYGASLSLKVRGNPDEGMLLDKSKKAYYDPKTNSTLYYWDSPLDSIAEQYRLTGGWLTQNQFFSLSDLNRSLIVHDSTVVLNEPYLDGADVMTLTTGLIDTEPDVYYYNIPGYNGKFCLDNYSSTPIFFPKKTDLNISYNIKYSKELKVGRFIFNPWKFSTPEGLDYYFAENDSARTLNSNGSFGGIDVSWDINRIINKNTLDTVSFGYRMHVNQHLELPVTRRFIEKNEYDTANSWSSWPQSAMELQQ
jgi:hypothetical protein